MLKKMIIIGAMMGVLISLPGCRLFRVHRQDVQQGNVLTSKQVKSIHRGMTQQQVVRVLGSPVLSNIYSPSQLIYIYSLEPAYKKLQRQYLILSFTHEKLTRIETDMIIPGDITARAKPLPLKKTHLSKKAMSIHQLNIPEPM
jgi:outer membrane protein assembly factor BamE